MMKFDMGVPGTSITIRTEFTKSDLERVIELHRQIYQDEFNYGPGFINYVVEGIRQFEENYDHERDRVWICECDRKLIGCLFIIHRDADNFQLRYFILLPKFRKIGLGKKLLQQSIEYLEFQKCNSVYLWTTVEQAPAAGLYKSFNFILVEEKETETFGKRLTEQKYIRYFHS